MSLDTADLTLAMCDVYREALDKLIPQQTLKHRIRMRKQALCLTLSQPSVAKFYATLLGVDEAQLRSVEMLIFGYHLPRVIAPASEVLRLAAEDDPRRYLGR